MTLMGQNLEYNYFFTLIHVYKKKKKKLDLKYSAWKQSLVWIKFTRLESSEFAGQAILNVIWYLGEGSTSDKARAGLAIARQGSCEHSEMTFKFRSVLVINIIRV